MPYLFKLSRRVARFRARALLVGAAAVLGACETSDLSLNAPVHPSFATSTGAPAQVIDLAAAAMTDSSATLTFTEVDDGTGFPASYDIRVAPAPLAWGATAPSVTRGTCSTPVAGTAIGTRHSCTVLGLVTGTAYQFQLVAFRGTLKVNAVFGPLSNVASGTARTPVPSGPPGTVTDLAVAGKTDTSITLRFTEVNDGSGQPASYDIRSVAGSTLSWGGTTPSVTRGTCATPVLGTTIGAVRTCTVLGLTAGTTYSFQLVAFRGTLKVNAVFGNLSNVVTGATAAVPVPSVVTAPGTVTDLKVASATDNGVTLSFTEVTDGSGRPASYDIRGVAGSSLSWGGSAPSVAQGTCAAPLVGTSIGSKRTCTVGGLSAGATYSFQLVAYRGTLAVNAVFGNLSNIATGTTTGTSSGGGGGSGGTGSGVTYYRTNFNDGTTGALDVYAYGGGSCAKSTDYRDAGSAYSMKCTIPAIDYGAAALQAWFGNGRLANTPKDPSLDQDLFQEVKFVFAPGATQAIASTSCVGTNSNSQIKVHKSVYGQAGSAWNGWVMSEIAPCMDGPIGLFSEPEMWNMNGTETVWPGTYPSIHEGTVYDVIYRYHRYTAQGCGTIAMWVNGTKVMDSPCWSYMGTTNGSAQGLLFWDGATYLQSGLGSLSMYTLFTQATNFPIGAATASR